MKPIGSTVAALAALSLGGCDLPPSGDSERRDAANQMAAEEGKAGAEGKAEEGRVSVRAPGIDFAINVPNGLRSQAQANVQSDFLPPGSRASGIHVQGDGGNPALGSDSVEIRFTVDRPPAEVAAWYNDPARRTHFTMTSAAREGEGLVVSGANKEGAPIIARLTPRAGGTDGRLIFVDRD